MDDHSMLTENDIYFKAKCKHALLVFLMSAVNNRLTFACLKASAMNEQQKRHFLRFCTAVQIISTLEMQRNLVKIKKLYNGTP